MFSTNRRPNPTKTNTQFVDSQAEAASAIGVNRHTLKEWLAEGAPRKTSAGYDLHAIQEWRALHKRPQDDTSNLEIPKEEFSKRLLMAKLRRAEGEALRAESEGKIKNLSTSSKCTTSSVVLIAS